MNIETRAWRIRSAPGGPGFTLTKKTTPVGPEYNRHIATAPCAHRLAMMTESQFNREAAEAWESGAWA